MDKYQEIENYIEQERAKMYGPAIAVLFEELCRVAGHLVGLKIAELKFQTDDGTIPDIVRTVLENDTYITKDERTLGSLSAAIQMLVSLQDDNSKVGE